MHSVTPPREPEQVDSTNFMEPTSPSQPQTPSSSAPRPAMTTSDGFDFEAEYEKAKHNLKFDEAILKKKDLERALHALESAKSEKSRLQEHKQQAEAVLEEKGQNWRELRAAHDKNQQEWRRRSIKVDDVLFKVDNHFVLRYRRGIESQIEFAKENLRLLEEHRQVDQAHAAVKKVRQTHKDLQARSYHQNEKIKGCEDEVLKVKKALDDALERLKTNNRGLEPVERLRTPPAQVYTQGAR